MHRDGSTPANGNDQDCAHPDIPYDLPSQRKSFRSLDDDRDPGIRFADEPACNEQEHDELVGRLIREGEALRTALGLPGFSPADTLPSTSSRTETPERSSVEHADVSVPEADGAPAHDAGVHRARRGRVPSRIGTSRRPLTRQVGPDELVGMRMALAEVRVERANTRSPWQRVRLRHAEASLVSIIMTGRVREARPVATERVRRMAERRKTDLIFWSVILYSSLVLTGTVTLGLPAWLSTVPAMLLSGAALWRQYLRENLHEPGTDQQPASHKHDQRT